MNVLFRSNDMNIKNLGNIIYAIRWNPIVYWIMDVEIPLCELMAQNFVNISFLMSPNPERSGPSDQPQFSDKPQSRMFFNKVNFQTFSYRKPNFVVLEHHFENIIRDVQ